MQIEREVVGAVFSGSAIHLLAHTGKRIDVEGVAVQSRWSEKGAWQQLRIQKKDGSGAIFPGDNIFLQAHTGKFIDVQEHAVQARFSDQGDWQTLTIEKKENRRLSDTTSEALALPI